MHRKQHAFNRVLAHYLQNVRLHGDPLEFVNLDSFFRSLLNRVHFYSFDKKERDLPVFDGLHFYELVHVDLVLRESHLGLLEYFTQGAFNVSFTLVDLAFWKVKLFHNTIAFIVVHNEKKFVSLAIEDESAKRGNLRLV